MQKNISEIKQICLKIFKNAGINNQLSEIVIDDLIHNDLDGYHSHGILRIMEYISYVRNKNIIPENQPIIKQLSNFVIKIDGNKSLGVIVKKEISKQLIQVLKKNKFGFVTFYNSGHIGRLAAIAQDIANVGGIVIGFLNSSGAGQIVLPFKGSIPKFSTNPILLGVPSSTGAILMDFSTSAYSEGKIRDAYYKDTKIPEGILIDKEGNSITDPKIFYERLGEIFLTPLGGKELGYKGFSLALFTEILSGILSGGSNVSDKIKMKGNSGFFITFAPEIFDINSAEFNSKVSTLINYIKSSNSENHFVRIPGLDRKYNENRVCLNIPKKLYQDLLKMQNV